MACFLGLVDVDAGVADAKAARYVPWRPREPALYAGDGAAGMHLQGRRWAVQLEAEDVSIFNSEACVRMRKRRACTCFSCMRCIAPVARSP
jgi:hypothetical protein